MPGKQTNNKDFLLGAMNIFQLSYHRMRAKEKSFNAGMKTDFDECKSTWSNFKNG